MFINCSAYPSVCVITRDIPWRIFSLRHSGLLIEVSNWVFIISGHHLRPSPIPPKSHPPCRLKSPKCIVHGVTLKQLTRETASVCTCVCARACVFEHECGPRLSLWPFLLDTVCGVEGVDSCGTPDSSWESMRLWPPSQPPRCVFGESRGEYMNCVWVCDIVAFISVERCLLWETFGSLKFVLIWILWIDSGFRATVQS